MDELSDTRHQHDSISLGRCGPAGQLRAPGPSDGGRGHGFHRLDPAPPPQSAKPQMGRAGPLHSVGGTRLHALVLATASHRVRSFAGGDPQLPTVGKQDPRSS